LAISAVTCRMFRLLISAHMWHTPVILSLQALPREKICRSLGTTWRDLPKGCAACCQPQWAQVLNNMEQTEVWRAFNGELSQVPHAETLLRLLSESSVQVVPQLMMQLHCLLSSQQLFSGLKHTPILFIVLLTMVGQLCTALSSLAIETDWVFDIDLCKLTNVLPI